MPFFSRTAQLASVLSVIGFAGACGDNAEVTTGSGAGAGGGPGADAGALDGSGGGFGIGATGTGGGDSGSGVDECLSASCAIGQRCVLDGTTPSCVDNLCSDLSCAASEVCEPQTGGGNLCVDASCSSDFDCAENENCNGTACVVDVCVAGSSQCDGETVLACSSNGGESAAAFTCGSSSYFVTECVDNSTGSAGCSCEGDWDCPTNTVCEIDTCVGTGLAPTCTLPPVPFTDVAPAVEIHWGGDSHANDDAHDGTPAQNPAPWARFAHVVSTPTVANLDDDNGDGLINELDFPEILFVAHNDSNPWDQGVIRAIHGGGENKGADYLARCGDKLWTEENPNGDSCGDNEPDGDSGAPVTVADLDNDGVPEIIYMTEGSAFRILDNTGAEIYSLPNDSWTPNRNGETLSVANLDYAGYAELIVGRNVFVLGNETDGDGGVGPLIVTHIFTGDDSDGSNDGNSVMSCPADVIPNLPGQEIVVGTTLYRLPDTIDECTNVPCSESLVTVWHAPDVGSQGSVLNNNLTEGFCAVADVWGADPDSPPGPDNMPDGVPEIILISDGNLVLLNPSNGVIIGSVRNLNGGERGGAPNVDDFDGDGFMEIASALEDSYVVIDLQNSTGAAGSCPDWPTTIARVEQNDGSHNTNPARNPGGSCTQNSDCDAAAVCNTTRGECVCLHNGWLRNSDDDSSRATSSSVFDFNGDGAAEVLYNDECDFRVYDGVTGNVLYSEISRSRTGIENPVVADVDNDGNAEIVTGMNTARDDRCDDDTNDGVEPRGPNGIRVWGDPTDTWVSARRIWNQQSYHVTNVTESGSIPMHPPESWGNFNGRSYNTYRSQPRSSGIAPDLRTANIGVSSPDAQCGALSDNIDIVVEIVNDGDLRVGPGVVVTFSGSWP
ncbi:MAG: VCBS repeat-containing protein, partial [Polyangiaceae bacterium]|nr:VCBS repeat-containing protein [Polyangiaceae bacterium]